MVTLPWLSLSLRCHSRGSRQRNPQRRTPPWGS
ncbi:CxxxxCH/CxxCH domain-containing protein, partial [Xanthomonas citri pv. mangiferaeindicae]